MILLAMVLLFADDCKKTPLFEPVPFVLIVLLPTTFPEPPNTYTPGLFIPVPCVEISLLSTELLLADSIRTPILPFVPLVRIMFSRTTFAFELLNKYIPKLLFAPLVLIVLLATVLLFEEICSAIP